MAADDDVIGQLEAWIDGELEVLVLQMEMASHNTTAEIERDVADAPTAEERQAGALTPAQAKVVDKMLDIRMRVKDNEAATAVRRAQVELLQQFKEKLDELRDRADPPQ